MASTAALPERSAGTAMAGGPRAWATSDARDGLTSLTATRAPSAPLRRRSVRPRRVRCRAPRRSQSLPGLGIVGDAPSCFRCYQKGKRGWIGRANAAAREGWGSTALPTRLGQQVGARSWQLARLAGTLCLRGRDEAAARPGLRNAAPGE
jgi:hypothetical protein